MQNVNSFFEGGISLKGLLATKIKAWSKTKKLRVKHNKAGKIHQRISTLQISMLLQLYSDRKALLVELLQGISICLVS